MGGQHNSLMLSIYLLCNPHYFKESNIMKRNSLSGWVYGLLLLPTSASVYAGNLDSATAPATTNYNIEDVYKRLNAGTAGSTANFTEPGSAPGQLCIAWMR